MQTQMRHLPPWLLSGPNGGNCPSVVGASIVRTTSSTARARDVYQSCWLHKPRDAASDSGSGCAQLASLWHLAVHYHPATSAESFCNSLRDLMPDPTSKKKEDTASKQEKPPAQKKVPAKEQKADASTPKKPTLQEKLQQSQQNLHQPYVPKKEQPPVHVQGAPSKEKKAATPEKSLAHMKMHVRNDVEEIHKNCVASVQRTLRGLAGDSPLAGIAGGNLGEAAKAECQRLHPTTPPKMCWRFSAALVAAAQKGPPVDAGVLCNRLLDEHHHHHSGASQEAKTNTEKPLKVVSSLPDGAKLALERRFGPSGASSISPITAVVVPAASPSKLPSKLPAMREIPVEEVGDTKKPFVSSASTTTSTTTPLVEDASRMLGAAAAPLRALSKVSMKVLTKLQQSLIAGYHEITGSPSNHTQSLITSKMTMAKAMEPNAKSATTTVTSTTTNRHEAKVAQLQQQLKDLKEELAAEKSAATTTMTTTTIAQSTTPADATATTVMITTTTTHALVNSSVDAGVASFLTSFESRYIQSGKPHENSPSTNSTTGSDDPASSFLSGFVSRYQDGATPLNSVRPQAAAKRAFVQLGSDDAAASFLSGFVSRYQDGENTSVDRQKKHKRLATPRVKLIQKSARDAPVPTSPDDTFVQSFLQRW